MKRVKNIRFSVYLLLPLLVIGGTTVLCVQEDGTAFLKMNHVARTLRPCQSCQTTQMAGDHEHHDGCDISIYNEHLPSKRICHRYVTAGVVDRTHDLQPWRPALGMTPHPETTAISLGLSKFLSTVVLLS